MNSPRTFIVALAGWLVKRFDHTARWLANRSDLQYFSNRKIAFGGGIYLGPWGIHIFLDLGKWLWSFESAPEESNGSETRS